MMADSELKWRAYGGFAMFLGTRHRALVVVVGARLFVRQVSGVAVTV